MDMKDRLSETIVSEERVFEGRLVKVNRLSVTLPDGRPAEREVVRHIGASAVVAVDEKKNVSLVRQYRVAMDRVMLEVPAGKLDSKDEDRLLAAKRELREETGLTAGRWTHLTDLITTPGFCDEVISLYLAEDLSQGEASPDDDEFLNVCKMPLEDAVRLCQRGELRDSKSVCALMLAQAALAARS